MGLLDKIAASPRGRREVAAARLRYEVLVHLHRALEHSGMTQSELANALGVSKGAVSQVLSGDGNLQVNTVAAYAAAMGQELRLELAPAGTAGPRAGEWHEDSAEVRLRMTVDPSQTQDARELLWDAEEGGSAPMWEELDRV